MADFPQKRPEWRSLGELNGTTIRKIAVDYIANDYSRGQILAKYHISIPAWHRIYHRMGLEKKREEYRKAVLEKALAKISDNQSRCIADTVEIMLAHVRQVKTIQNTEFLNTEILNDVLKIHALLSKDKRLDEGKPTDRNVTTILVEGMSMPTLTDRKVIDVPKQEAPATPTIEQKNEADKGEAISVVVDESIVSVL